jgi:hypothetical protein
MAARGEHATISWYFVFLKCRPVKWIIAKFDLALKNHCSSESVYSKLELTSGLWQGRITWASSCASSCSKWYSAWPWIEHFSSVAHICRGLWCLTWSDIINWRNCFSHYVKYKMELKSILLNRAHVIGRIMRTNRFRIIGGLFWTR